MGMFRRRKYPKAISEQVLAEMETNNPIALNLDNQKFTLDKDGNWSSEVPVVQDEVQKEIHGLRKEKRKLRKEVEKYYKQAEELKDMKEKMNLLDFKYQLLLDMWSSRVGDKEKKYFERGGDVERSHLIDRDSKFSQREEMTNLHSDKDKKLFEGEGSKKKSHLPDYDKKLLERKQDINNLHMVDDEKKFVEREGNSHKSKGSSRNITSLFTTEIQIRQDDEESG